jgi:hypothetical protein
VISVALRSIYRRVKSNRHASCKKEHRVDLDVVAEKKIPAPKGNRTSGHSAHSQSLPRWQLQYVGILITMNNCKTTLNAWKLCINGPSKIQTQAFSSRRGVTSQDGEQGCGPLKPRCEASCRRLPGTEVTAESQTTPSGHRAAPHCMCVCLPPAWGSAGGDCLILWWDFGWLLIPQFLWD